MYNSPNEKMHGLRNLQFGNSETQKCYITKMSHDITSNIPGNLRLAQLSKPITAHICESEKVVNLDLFTEVLLRVQIYYCHCIYL